MERLVFERDICGKSYRVCVRPRPQNTPIFTYQVFRALPYRNVWQGVPPAWASVRSMMDEAFASDLASFRTRTV